MPERDLEDHLEGLFSDAAAEPEEDASIAEDMLDALLEAGAESDLVPDGSGVVDVLLAVRQEAGEGAEATAPAVDAIVEAQRVRALNALLAALAALGGLAVGGLLIDLLTRPERWLVYSLYVSAYVALAALALTRRLSPKPRLIALVVVTYAVALFVLFQHGPIGVGLLFLLAAPLLLAAFGYWRAAAVAMGISVTLLSLFLAADYQGWLRAPVPYDRTRSSSALGLVGAFAAISAAVICTQGVFSSLLVRQISDGEESRNSAVAARALAEQRADELATANALLQKQALQLQATAHIVHAAGLLRSPDELMREIVERIRERFDLYYVGLFLCDDSGQCAVLRAGTGEAGRQMLAQGYRVEVGSAATIGSCMAEAHARLALNVEDDAALFDNPRLPETRSEVALPLCSQGRAWGALSLQSVRYDAFSADELPLLQMMADQLAVLLENARLLSEARERLEELDEQRGQQARDRWASFVRARAMPYYERAQPDAPPLDQAVLSEIEQAIAQREVVAWPGAEDGQRPAVLVAPLRLRDQVIGALGLHQTAGERRWTADERMLVEAVADEMALAIENARLLDETHRRAERERISADISAQVRASTDIDNILRTAIRELGRSLRAADGLIQLRTDDGAGPAQEEREQVG